MTEVEHSCFNCGHNQYLLQHGKDFEYATAHCANCSLNPAGRMFAQIAHLMGMDQTENWKPREPA